MDKCPKCGNESLGMGYGLAGGGIGVYFYCETEGCDYFDKTQDPEIGDHYAEELCQRAAKESDK